MIIVFKSRFSGSQWFMRKVKNLSQNGDYFMYISDYNSLELVIFNPFQTHCLMCTYQPVRVIQQSEEKLFERNGALQNAIDYRDLSFARRVSDISTY